MDIQINSDNRTDITGGAITAFEDRIGDRLARFASRLSRIEAHVRDHDGASSTDQGIEVSLEARPNGGDPVRVAQRGADIDGALSGALATLVTTLDRHFGKQDRHRA